MLNRLVREKMTAKRRNVQKRAMKRRTRKRHVRKSSFPTIWKKVMKLSPLQRIEAMRIANNRFINDLTREIRKLRHSHVSPGMQKRLKRQSRKLRTFINARTPISTKRRMLTQQRGGFLPLLMAALPAIGSIVGGVLSRV